MTTGKTITLTRWTFVGKVKSLLFFFLINYFNWKLITLQYCSGFCHTLTWVSHGCTCVPHPEPPSYLPPHPIPLGHPSAPALSTPSHASNLDWRSVSHMIIYMFQWYSLKSSHPCLLPPSTKENLWGYRRWIGILSYQIWGSNLLIEYSIFWPFIPIHIPFFNLFFLIGG